MGTEALCLCRPAALSVLSYSTVSFNVQDQACIKIVRTQIKKIVTLASMLESALALYDALQTVQGAMGVLTTLHGDEQGDACIGLEEI